MIVLFDLDSTLCTIEWCDVLADAIWCGVEVANITEQTMNGDMDFDTAFPAKHDLIAAGTQDILAIADIYLQHITPGMTDLIKDLHTAWHKVWILTQWYQPAAEILGKKLGIEKKYIFWIEFEFDEQGEYVWFPEQLLKYADGKSWIIKSLKTQNCNTKICFVWDSVRDMVCGADADFFIWFGGVVVRPAVEKTAEKFVYSIKELRKELLALN